MRSELKPRSRWDIIQDILEVIAISENRAKKTRFMKKAYLDWRNFQRHFGFLIEGDIHIKIHEDGGTESGTELAGCTIANSSVNTSYSWVNGSLNCSLAGETTYWLVLASPDASGGYDYYWGADYKSNGGEAWYYDGKSWTRDNLDCLTMAFELFV